MRIPPVHIISTALALVRREFVLRSFSAPLVLGSLLNIGAVERPSNLGIQDYGGGVRTLVGGGPEVAARGCGWLDARNWWRTCKSSGPNQPALNLTLTHAGPPQALCPSTPNCIATSEESNDESHYVPPWTYAPQDGRGGKGPIPPEQVCAGQAGRVFFYQARTASRAT